LANAHAARFSAPTRAPPGPLPQRFRFPCRGGPTRAFRTSPRLFAEGEARVRRFTRRRPSLTNPLSSSSSSAKTSNTKSTGPLQAVSSTRADVVAVGDFWRRGCRGRDGWDFSDATCWNVTLTGPQSRSPLLPCRWRRRLCRRLCLDAHDLNGRIWPGCRRALGPLS